VQAYQPLHGPNLKPGGLHISAGMAGG
jgi:hypothetical protein